MDYNDIKLEIISVRNVLEICLEPKPNAITEFVFPILKKVLNFIDEQEERIKYLEERIHEGDSEAKAEYFNNLTEQQGRIKDLLQGVIEQI